MARWERSGSARVGEYGVFDVFRHVVQREGAEPKTIHTFTTLDWANIVPVTANGELVLVRVHRFGIDGPSLEIPGGLIDPGEEPLAAARRELREETGYEAESLEPLGVIHANPALQPTRVHMFVARGCRPHPQGQALEDLEDIEVVVVPRGEVDGMLRRGEITHGIVWAALHAFELAERR